MISTMYTTIRQKFKIVTSTFFMRHTNGWKKILVKQLYCIILVFGKCGNTKFIKVFGPFTASWAKGGHQDFYFGTF